MKKIYLMKVVQFSTEFFVGVCDPRVLVKIADSDVINREDNVPEAQRPLDKKHLKEISEYVGKKDQGLLPSTIIISTKDRDKLSIQKENNGVETIYFINLPETDSEIADYQNTIDVIDGQHRLFSFHKNYIDLNVKDTDSYLMPFTLFETPLLDQRRSLFTITNEKQKPVSPNLLLYLKEKLNLLNADEKKYYPFVRNLAEQSVSPLKGRIIMSSERITKGLKAKEILKICKISKLDTSAARTRLSLDDGKFLVVVSEYLGGWEAYYGFKFNAPTGKTQTKISGLRYIMLLFDTFLERFLQEATPTNQLKFDSQYVKSLIEKLENMKMEEAGANWQTDDTLFTSDAYKNSFRGEGATVKMAQDDAVAFRSYLNRPASGYNPFA